MHFIRSSNHGENIDLDHTITEYEVNAWSVGLDSAAEDYLDYLQYMNTTA